MSRRRRKSEPVSVGKGVSRVLAELGLDTAREAFQIGERWEEAVGSEIARHARPVAVRSGVLEVVVDSSVWCQQLQLRRVEILEALDRTLEGGAPTQLRLRVGYTGAP